MKRLFDIVVAGVALIVLALPMLLLCVAVRLTSPGPAIHWSKRVGQHGRLFAMPKLRTMRIDTPQVATHLMGDPAQWLTPIGGFLRRYSLDEAPQLWSVLTGEMSLVGPRPALFNQDDLMALRRADGVDALRPGLTGWAQINGRDELTLAQKAALDREYMLRQSMTFDIRILFATGWIALTGRGIAR